MPPLVLTIEVDDKGTPVLKQFSGEVQKVGATTATAADQMEKSSRGVELLTSSFARGAAGAVGFGAALVGLHSAQAAIVALVSGYTSFENALANANTLIPRQTALQAQLREEVLRLPPALGSSAELAQGLYAVLSAGIKPAESVKFLAQSAELAKAGLSDLDTATTALTKVMQVYGFTTADTTKISDTLFQTVNLGQGTLQQFAGALPNVLVVSKSLGVSFDDASAALATLSNAFRSPFEAATGLRSLFNQLTQNASEFTIRGINLREVIQEKGLLGALEALRTLTQGNAQAVREFIPDIEGQQAALTLLGAQYQKFIDNQGKLRESAGSTRAALEEQSKTITAAANRVAVELQRPATILGTFASEKIQASLNKLADGLVLVRTAITSIGQTGGQVLAGELPDAVIKSTKAFTEHATVLAKGTQQYRDLQEQIHGNIVVTDDFAKALREEDSINKAVKDSLAALGNKGSEALKDLANSAISNFDLIAKSGKETPENLQKIWESVVQKIIAAYGEIPANLQGYNREIQTGVTATTEGIAASFQRLRVKTTEELQTTALAALANFKNILDSGKATPQELLDVWQRILKQISEAGFKTLPPGFAEVNAQLQAIAKKAGIELPKPYTDAFGQINTSAQTQLTAAAKAFQDFEQVFLEADKVLRNDAARTREAVEGIASGFHVATQAVNAYGNAASDASAETQKLIDLQIQSQTTFAKDVPGLLAQLKQARTELNNYLNSPGAGQRGPGETEFQTANYRKIINQILLNLAGLGVDQFGQPLTTGGSGGTGTGGEPSTGGATIVIGGGGLGGIRPGAPGSPTFVGFGPGDLGLNPVIPTQPTTLLPGIFTPTPAPTLQPIFQAPGGSSGGGGGGGGTPAGPTVPAIGAPQQGAQGSGGNQGLNSPTLPGPSLPDLGAGTTRGVNVSINNVQFMGPATRQGALDFVNEIGHALREFIRRGGLVA